LVTVAPAAGPARLLKVPLAAGGATQVLWQVPADDGRLLVAPLALPAGRIALVRQTRTGDSSLLSVLGKAGIHPAEDLELPARIHQLAARDPQGQQILALTLGAEENHPAFLHIDLAARSVENLGFSPALYQAVFSLSQGRGAIVAFLDNSSETGWDLAWVDAAGKFLKDVQARTENDLLPALQPNGTGLAFLAEVPEADPKP
jgi:hypothetical protein